MVANLVWMIAGAEVRRHHQLVLELIAALELANLMDVGETVAVSALNRKESRGAHTRRDFTTRDDENYLHHSLCYFGSDGPRIDKKAVTLGHWEPEERKY